MYLTLSQLKESIAAISAHPLTDTNVSGVELRSDGLYVEGNNDDLQARVEELEAEIKDWEKEVAELEHRAFSNERDAALLADVNDGVCSIDEYRDKAKASEERAERWRLQHGAMERELTDLRKRKGDGARLVRHQRAVMAFLSSAAYGTHTIPDRNAAKDLLALLKF